MIRAGILLLLVPVVLGAQTPAGVIRVEAREVVVDVTATDGKGVAVADLTKGAFSIRDEGKPRVIDAFTVSHEFPAISGVASTAPLRMAGAAVGGSGASAVGHSTAIILDEVNTFFEDAATARQNVLDLMGKVPADERIALYAIVRKQGLLLLQDYTTDRDLLKRSLAKHTPSGLRPADSQPPHFFVDQPIPPAPARPPFGVGEKAALWRDNQRDARGSLQALAEQLNHVSGRKSVFWVTNAFHPWVLGLGKEPPPGSEEDGLNMEKPAWEKTFTALNEADVAVNVVDSRGLYGAADPGLGTIAVMKEVADKTGGKAYFNRNDLDGAMAEGIGASRTIYTLRFHLPDSERDKRFHALKVKVDRPGLELFYRQGYYAGGTETPVDLVSGKVAGQALELRAASVDAGSLDADIQLPYFYTGTNRANVHLSVDLAHAGVRGQVEIVGIAVRSDGSEAARFVDSAEAGGQYEHQFLIGAGSYVFRLEVGAGTAVSKTDVPLQIEPWSSGTFGMSSIAFSTQARPAIGPTGMGALVAGGKEFVPAASNRFSLGQPIYFYTEVYDSSSAGLAIQYRILDSKTGEVKVDSGVGSVAGYVRPGVAVVPFATRLSIGGLAAGFYRLEVRAVVAANQSGTVRTADMEIY